MPKSTGVEFAILQLVVSCGDRGWPGFCTLQVVATTAVWRAEVGSLNFVLVGGLAGTARRGPLHFALSTSHYW